VARSSCGALQDRIAAGAAAISWNFHDFHYDLKSSRPLTAYMKTRGRFCIDMGFTSHCFGSAKARRQVGAAPRAGQHHMLVGAMAMRTIVPRTAPAVLWREVNLRQGSQMASQLELSARSALCRELAKREPTNRVLWTAEAENWSRLSNEKLRGEPEQKSVTASWRVWGRVPSPRAAQRTSSSFASSPVCSPIARL
jgi:hypothetical protein